jgi:signal transduction histidine kinase
MNSHFFKRPEAIEWLFILVTLVLFTTSALVVWQCNDFTIRIRTTAMGILSAALLSVLFVSMLARLLHRVIALGFQLILVMVITRLTGANFIIVELALSFSIVFAVALQFPVRIGLISVAGSIVLIAMVGYAPERNVLERLLVLFFQLAMGGISILLVEYRERLVESQRIIAEQRQSLENLAAANHSFVAHLEEVEAESEERERLRITRELHDTIGYSMTTLTMMMKASHYLIDKNPDKLLEYCERSEELAGGTLRETREILYKLRSIRHPSRLALPLFFSRLCRDFEDATGVRTECHPGNLPNSTSEKVFNVLFRAVQTGLINAIRHGQARYIRLFFNVSDERLLMSLRNDSRVDTYFENYSEGIGLQGVRERLDLLGGTMRLELLVDGFEMTTEIPITEVDNDTSSDS